MNDAEYMKIALELAQKGCGFVAPNPMVGALIVKDGVITGQGYHECYGELHAERNAFAHCAKTCNESSNKSLQGATLYVTLEPCCHYGKNPPCTDAIIENEVARVVIGSADPNPLVNGKGVELLRQRGIEVVEGVLQKECDALNQVFFHYIKTQTPYVVMKYAMTMDGKIATHTGQSKWITGDLARQNVQRDRHRYSAIMVGINTVLADDPLLTCRLDNAKNPVRIICDTQLNTPLLSKVVTTTNLAKTILATACTDVARHKAFLAAGCEILVVPLKGAHIDLGLLMKKLGEKNIDSIILEGGSTLNWSALESGIVNKVQAYISPKLFGGLEAKSPISGLGVASPDAAYFLSTPTISIMGNDILLESEVVRCSPEL